MTHLKLLGEPTQPRIKDVAGLPTPKQAARLRALLFPDQEAARADAMAPPRDLPAAA
jgi:hypothetical protein